MPLVYRASISSLQSKLPNKAAPSIYVLWGSPFVSCLSRRLPRSASGSDPESFPIPAFALRLEACEVLLVLFKSTVYVFASSPISKPQQSVKPVLPGAHLPEAGPLAWGVQRGACTTCSFRRTSTVGLMLPFMCCLPEDLVATIPRLLPSSVGSLHLYLWKTSPASLQVVLVDSWPIDSCNFDVPTGGGSSVKFFLLQNLGHII